MKCSFLTEDKNLAIGTIRFICFVTIWFCICRIGFHLFLVFSMHVLFVIHETVLMTARGTTYVTSSCALLIFTFLRREPWCHGFSDKQLNEIKT